MTVYFVDEDKGYTKPFRSELFAEGYEVKPFTYADDALSHISGAHDVELVIIDVMLGVRSSRSGTFKDARTNDGSIAGLVLLEELALHRPDIFPQRAVLFTHSTLFDVLSATEALAKKMNIEWYKKSRFSEPYSFGTEIRRVINILEKGD